MAAAVFVAQAGGEEEGLPHHLELADAVFAFRQDSFGGLGGDVIEVKALLPGFQLGVGTAGISHLFFVRGEDIGAHGEGPLGNGPGFAGFLLQ